MAPGLRGNLHAAMYDLSYSRSSLHCSWSSLGLGCQVPVLHQNLQPRFGGRSELSDPWMVDSITHDE